MSFNLTLIAQAVAFALFIWFTVKFVWPPLLRAIEARQKTIADGLAAAEQGKKSLEQAGKQAGEEIAGARTRAAASSMAIGINFPARLIAAKTHSINAPPRK